MHRNRSIPISKNITVKGIIYKATNKLNGKIYIGQTIRDLEQRKKDHISKSKRNKPACYFHRAIKKYGIESFDWEILDRCNSKHELDDLEFYYIKYYGTYYNGYNSTMGGEGTIGRYCTEETKQKISKANKGRKRTDAFKRKQSEIKKGIKKPKDHVRKVADSVSRYWEITYPNGKVEVIKNLEAFCRKNKISPSGMGNVSRGLRNHYKKYKCKKLGKPVEV